jgi:hypothetical protein
MDRTAHIFDGVIDDFVLIFVIRHGIRTPFLG